MNRGRGRYRIENGIGNSLAVARGLQQALEGAERYPIAAGRTRLDAPCDHLILVFPVYAGGLPAPSATGAGRRRPGSTATPRSCSTTCSTGLMVDG
jgi:hypothetical protein